MEDEATALSHEYNPVLVDTWKIEVPYRGDINQLPIILEVDQPSSEPSTVNGGKRKGHHREFRQSSSSSESSSPLTPDFDESNHDRRYVYVPEKGIEIPLTYDEPRTPKYEKKPPPKKDDRRGGPQRPEVEISLPKLESSRKPETRPHLERLPSPYAYASKTFKNMDTHSGEYMLSPDVMSPRVKLIEKQNQRFRNVSQPATNKENEGSSHASRTSEAREQPSRSKHASGGPQPTERIGRSGNPVFLKSTPYPTSSDESDVSSDEFPESRDVVKKPDQNSPQSPRLFTMPHIEDFSQPKEGKRRSLQQPILPYARALSALDSRAPPAGYTPVGLESVNALLSSPRSDRRQASPRGSPVNMRHSTPPMTPPGDEFNNRNASRAPTPRNTPPTSTPTSRPSSRPSSPHSRQAAGLIPRTSNQPESLKNVPRARSRLTSPLPSPGLQGTSTPVAPRIDVRAPSPANQKRFSSGDGDEIKKADSTHAILAPLELPRPPTLATPSAGQRRRTLSNVETRPQLPTNSTWAQNDTGSAQSPRARSRPSAPSRAVSFGIQPQTLPPCSRLNPVSGFNDWYTLVDFPSFSICPSCREAVSSTGHGQHFTPSLSKSPEVETRCDFSIPWVRMAWLLTVKNRRLDLDTIYAMAEITANEAPCPGKRGPVRQWYRVVDVENMKQLSSFNACSYCVRHLETLFPVLRGVFQKSRSRYPTQERPCDLRSDSKRFPAYVDHLETIANQARECRRSPDTIRFIELVKKMASTRECSRDDMLLNQRWHIMTQIPEFTVCEECYDEVVLPAIDRGSTLATQFSRYAHRVAHPDLGVSCQLYSPQMRNVFAEACRRNDLTGFRAVAVKRYQVEGELQARNAEVQRADIGDEERAERVKELVEDWKRWE